MVAPGRARVGSGERGATMAGPGRESELTHYHCPKCGAQCAAAGTLELSGARTLVVFQCDTCVVAIRLFGEPEDVAYTFGVGGDGRVEDIQSPDVG